MNSNVLAKFFKVKIQVFNVEETRNRKVTEGIDDKFKNAREHSHVMKHEHIQASDPSVGKRALSER